ncbi:ABC transporter ATP-binding protein [Pseudoclavibacter chungangensis]|uniref:ABC transporter ATP-binding protein n=1 Tax=Pseudoclavibacter chungangensis TaxID=587635 RepID=A0A7J5BPW3_9MICO|nr:ABC transporter ATP-binding protein [Pseudoclavibacter chungangensis]KAB1655367.1 ABC transporter ATP-binding protein [Pseudoclavibacter chungangensis]NYJ68317.1 Ca2+/Na+ antiporter [Pseudoclavibacter chungangensis]
MSRAARYAEAIHTQTSLTIPGSVVARLGSVIMFATVTVVYAVIALQSGAWWMPLVMLVLVPAFFIVTLFQVRSLRYVRRAYRMSPEGLSYENLPFVPWSECRGAYVVTSGGEAGERTIILSLTPEGGSLLRNSGLVGRAKLSSGSNITVRRFGGCSLAVTARLLTEAVVVNRRRLGLAPVR